MRESTKRVNFRTELLKVVVVVVVGEVEEIWKLKA